MAFVKLYEEFMSAGKGLEKYRDISQSMVRFRPGQAVRCINPDMPFYGKVGTVIAFEDATIRWKVAGSETGVGQTAEEYRCQPQDLETISA